MLATKKNLATMVLVICLVVTARAQDAAVADVVRVDTSLVSVNVSVTNSKGRHLQGLRAEDFQVTDQGLPVQPEFFDSHGPASIVFVVDVSSSMQGKWRNLKSGLKKFLADSHEDNDYTLITFNQTPRLIASSVRARELWQRFNKLSPSGETALYDALLLGLNTLARLPSRHKALVVLSDGADTSSLAKFPAVLHEATTQRATIYTVGVFLYPLKWKEPEDQELLKRIASGSGGLSLFPPGEEISGAMEIINTDVRGQYTLSYYQPDKTPGNRTIQVRVTQDPLRYRLRYQQTYIMR
jgi:Ca-activated chloride channel homolog